MKQDVRDRLVLPLLVPVGLLLAIAAAAVGFGMLLLFNPMVVALMMAIVVSAAIIGGFALALSRSSDELDNLKRGVIVFAGLAPVVVGALVAFDVLETADAKVAERECHYCVPEDAVEVVGVDIAFEPEEIGFPDAGEGDAVSILFRNEDQGIPHNIWIYPFEQEEPLLDEPVFEGGTFDGVAQEVYDFEAPAQGTYYFNCTVHPQQMTGTVTFGES